MSYGGSTPRRPGAPAAETPLEQAKREYREWDQKAAEQHVLMVQAQREGRSDAEARQRMMRYLDLREAGGRRIEQLEAGGKAG